MCKKRQATWTTNHVGMRKVCVQKQTVFFVFPEQQYPTDAGFNRDQATFFCVKPCRCPKISKCQAWLRLRGRRAADVFSTRIGLDSFVWSSRWSNLGLILSQNQPSCVCVWIYTYRHTLCVRTVCSTTVQYVTLYYNTLHCITFHYIPFHYILLNYIPLHSIAFHSIPYH